MASVSFPVKADEKYRTAFNALARDKGRFMADLVRDAIDAMYGEEMKPYLSFFETSGSPKNQIEREGTPHG